MNHTVELVPPSINADGKKTRPVQSINPQIACESHDSLIDTVSSVDGLQQQQEQCAGSSGVKTLSPKHKV